MDEYTRQRRINKVRQALENGKLLSVKFYRDGFGAMFYFIDPTGDHGMPCEMGYSFPIEEALLVIRGFRFQQY